MHGLPELGIAAELGEGGCYNKGLQGVGPGSGGSGFKEALLLICCVTSLPLSEPLFPPLKNLEGIHRTCLEGCYRG